MIRNFRGILGTWVFSTETRPSLPVGKIADIVVDPNIGKCVAMWVKTLDGLRLLDFRDIVKWGNDIHILTRRDIVKPEEFPRISAILDREVPIIGAEVFVHEEEIPRKIGVVVNFAFQQEFTLLLAIQVNTGWWIFGKKIEIPRTRILEINEEGIFITGNQIKVEKKVEAKIVPSLD
jgi:uncharacterized protein YrrD